MSPTRRGIKIELSREQATGSPGPTLARQVFASVVGNTSVKLAPMPFSSPPQPLSESNISLVPEQQGVLGLFQHDPVTGGDRCFRMHTTENLRRELRKALSDESGRATHFAIEICAMYPEGARLVHQLRKEYGLPERRAEPR